jgi:hypothetical protein
VTVDLPIVSARTSPESQVRGFIFSTLADIWRSHAGGPVGVACRRQYEIEQYAEMALGHLSKGGNAGSGGSTDGRIVAFGTSLSETMAQCESSIRVIRTSASTRECAARTSERRIHIVERA